MLDLFVVLFLWSTTAGGALWVSSGRGQGGVPGCEMTVTRLKDGGVQLRTGPGAAVPRVGAAGSCAAIAAKEGGVLAAALADDAAVGR